MRTRLIQSLSRHGSGIVWLIPLMLSLGADAQTRQQNLVRGQDEVLEVVLDALSLVRAEVQEISVVAQDRARFVSLRLQGADATLDLVPHSLRSPDFRVLVQDETGVLADVEPPAPATYRGRVAEDPDAKVSATLIDGQLTAMIHLSNGARLQVRPVREVLPDALAKLHVVYEDADVIPQEGSCGADEQTEIGHLDEGSRTASMVGGGRTQIAFDADFEYYESNGSSVASTVADIEFILSEVALLYREQLDICYELTSVVVRTTPDDPYTATNPNDLLDEFTAEWDDNVSISRDVAHLMTGKNIDGSTIGIAWIGVMCSDNWAYGLSQSRYTSNLASRVQLTAHELGHNWNACHCNQSGCTGDGADSDCGIMRSYVSGEDEFGFRALGTIAAHRDSRSCLGDCPSTASCGNPTAGACDQSNGSPACSLEPCCEAICNIDPYCCEYSWDSICAGRAVNICDLTVPGDECESCTPTAEGSFINITLSDNSGSTGDDTSCGAGDELDEWYCYTASCSGTATADICTEFTSVDITLAAFDSCSGSELACSHDDPSCPYGASLSASLSFAVSAGQTYQVRVSGVDATPESNFIGSLSFSCDGSANPADVNADGVVGPGDLAIVLNYWGPQPNGHPADINNDGFVGPPDLSQVLGAWSP